jgi:hypothetical protein
LALVLEVPAVMRTPIGELPVWIGFLSVAFVVGVVPPSRKTWTTVLLRTFVAVIVAVERFSRGMWLPPANLCTSSGEVSGYVLEQVGDDLVVLDLAQNNVDRLPVVSVVSRQ